MNEQIKLLWEKAAKTTQGDSWEEQIKFMERFAELIVRECCAIADQVERADMDSYVSKHIKAHFGVEE
jgi:hypothetical protein